MIVGVDVGGTFTDVVAWDGTALRTAKVPTTADQSEAVVSGVRRLTQRAERLLHGTTAATNALLQRTGARTLLVTTPGFEDVLEIGRQDRPSLYDPFADRPAPLVDREDRVGDADPLDAALLSRYGAVAIACLRSFADPTVERAARDRIAAIDPDLPLSVSSEVVPEFREFERTSTTVLNAYVTPSVAAYLERLEATVRRQGLADGVAVMRSSGGTIPAAEAARFPAAILLSGPAGGVVAAAALGAVLGRDDVIAFDMGGTSTDVCHIGGGTPEIAYERDIEGYPCRMPSAAINTVGAGGGSIGWVDPGGSLRVGPRSAGSQPGPACYRRGGTDATVTDANVVLGRIAAQTALGGSLDIDGSAALAALERLGRQVGLGAADTALGVVRVVEEVMAGAIRSVSIERGRDPRTSWLVAFGGAGGLHASALARSLDMAGVLVPPHGGVFSAAGLLLSPSRRDVAHSILLRVGDDLDGEVRARAAQAAQLAPEAAVTTLVDVRYVGQSHELTVPYPAGEGWPALAARFHRMHEERNGFSRPQDAVEVVTVRASATGTAAIEPAAAFGWVATGPDHLGTRTVTTSRGRVRAEVWRRAGLAVGSTLTGPAVVEEEHATTWLDDGDVARVDASGAVEVTW